MRIAGSSSTSRIVSPSCAAASAAGGCGAAVGSRRSASPSAGQVDAEGGADAGLAGCAHEAAVLPHDSVAVDEARARFPRPSSFVVKNGSKTCARVSASMPDPVSVTASWT